VRLCGGGSLGDGTRIAMAVDARGASPCDEREAVGRSRSGRSGIAFGGERSAVTPGIGSRGRVGEIDARSQ
jgi:hypothetical protein